MSVNVDVVNRMLDCYCRMDADGLADVLAPDAKHTCPGSDFGTDIDGSPAIVDYFKTRVFPSFHQVRFEAVHTFEDSARSAVIVEWRSHLFPKSGKNYSNNGVFVIEVRDGRVAWVREYFDTEKSNKMVN